MKGPAVPPFNHRDRYSAIVPLSGPSDLTLLRVYDVLRSEDLALCTTVRQKGVAVDDAAAEFAKLRTLDHPLLAQVRDFGATGEVVFYSRELGLPSTLKELPKEELDEDVVYALLVAASEAVEALHDAGLVHGLVLPEHVHVSILDGGFSGMRLADAGLRRLLTPASLKRRERYDPPEVRKGGEASPASDIYQLGMTLLEKLGRTGSSRKSSGSSRLERPPAGGVDRHLRDLLTGLVTPDPHRRLTNGRELRRALRAVDWTLPDRMEEVSSLMTPFMVGREHEMGQFVATLKKAAAGEVHAIEIVGQRGTGRTRMLRECGERGEAEGWIAIPVSGEAGEKRVEEALSRVGEAKMLLLVDNADHLDPDVLARLRFLVAEAETSPVLVVSTGEKSLFAGTEVISLDPLGARDLRRLVEPLLLKALNPEEVLRAVEESAAGNPLWVQLLLASWRESGRLRFVHGRPFFDERADAGVPESIAEVLAKIVGGLTRIERDLVEAMAIWGAPLPKDVAERVLPDNPTVPGSLVRTDGASYRFIGDTVGPVILGLMSKDRQRHWHAAFLSVLAEKELGRRQRAFHLLGAGKAAEGIRALVDEARAAESRNDYRIAFVNLRDALECYFSNDVLEKDVPGVERTRLTLDAARLATLVGELHWAREVLVSSILEGAGSPSIHLEHTVLRANVLRELRHASEAAELYAEARALIARHPSLQDQLVPVQLEEAANDGARGEGQGALRRLETIVKKLEGEGTSPLLGLSLQRMGLLCAQLGRTRAGLVYELRCLRIARRLNDHQLAARALVNLGHFYRLLGRPRRALLTFDRAQRELVSCPNDSIAASEMVNRAEVLIGLGREDEAYMLLLRARALRERAAERARMVPILILLGHLCHHGGKLLAGAGYYREAIALAEEFELPAARVAQSNLGELHLQMGAWEEAERLLRLGLSDPKPDHRGLTMVNLGRLRREQGRHREALQLLGEAETLLGGVSAHYRTHAVLETARVLFAAGDVEGAAFHLLQVRDDDKDKGQLVGYRVLEGLIASTRGEAPERAFKSALDVVQESHDPTLVAEALTALLERALMSSEFDPTWFARQLEILEDAASRTEARPVAMRASVIRAGFSERCAAAAGVEGFAGKLQQRIERSGSAVEAAIGELLKELPGAEGAAVFVVGFDGQGKPMLSAARKTSKPQDKRIRPYRVAVREFDRNLFRRALDAAGGNVHEAARKLRLPISTFRYRAIKLGLLKPTPRD